ncbi:MAG: hypothetical protein V1904_15425 [Bacteroidota bacterium]
MKFLTTLILFYLLLANAIFGQDHDSIQKINSSRNTIYLELFGNASLYTINYDRILFDFKKTKTTGRIGLCYMPKSSKFSAFTDKSIVLPLEINQLFGRKNDFFELGLSTTFFFVQHEYTSIMLFPKIGFRHQKRNGGFFHKVSYAPLISIFENPSQDYGIFFPPMIGISIGYTFRTRH